MTGTQRYLGRVHGKAVERPHDAVETWDCRIQQRSAWSPEEYTSRVIWHDPFMPKAEREALRARFSRPF